MKTNYFSKLKNNIFLFFSVVLLSALVFSACSSDEDKKVDPPFFEIDGAPSELLLDASESTTNYRVQSNTEWEIVAQNEGDWIVASPSKLTGSGLLRIIVKENETFEQRTMNFIFKVDGKEVYKLLVQQKGIERVLNVPASDDGLSVATEGGNIQIEVEGNVVWKYSIDVDSWLSESNISDDRLELLATANEHLDERTAIVTITSESMPDFSAEVVITQAGVPPVISVPASEDGLLVIPAGGNVQIEVEGNVVWKYSIDDDSWLSEVSLSNSQLELKATENKGQERIATVTITTESIPDFSAKVVITQALGEPTSGSGDTPSLPGKYW
ncbi:MAG: BACON domain-containing carbohydrate-binding protein [Dysgonamonadaceae bacterium]|nr:BACON domain-containing carbohydrate-binding protein [Dysgonamonadaceae bacterium]